ASAFARNTDGSFFPNVQRITPATMPKLIHLKSSVACSVAALPSSAADAAQAHNNNTPHTLIAIKASRRKFIAPHSVKRLPSRAWQSLRQAVARPFRVPAWLPRLPSPLSPLPRLLPMPPNSATPSAGPPAHPTVFSERLPAPRKPLLAPVLELPGAVLPFPRQRPVRFRRPFARLPCAFRAPPSRQVKA